MQIEPGTFREVMGRLAGGVAIVTAQGADGEPRGFTATAVCSVSLDPPLVLVCVGLGAHTGPAIRAAGRYALNFLPSTDTARADRFAGSEESKFEGVDWVPAPGGSPIFAGALAWLECDVEQEVEAGDHMVFIGRVTGARLGLSNGAPLVHFGGRFHTVAAIEE
jgi:flavin reductase (DIM6/NTAB) family NADH-FMN oxidoreductase RutF